MLYVLCLNSSKETKIKTLFLHLYFDLLRKRNGTLGTRICYYQLLRTLMHLKQSRANHLSEN